jgi:hypothetical protein
MGMPGKTYSAFGGTGSPLHFSVPDLGPVYGKGNGAGDAARTGASPESVDLSDAEGCSTMWGRCDIRPSDVV